MEPARYSQLKLMADCAAVYHENARMQTRCMEVGSAADSLVFGTKKVISYPGAVRRGKEWEAFVDEHFNETTTMIVTKSELAEATAIAAAVWANPRAAKVLKGEFQKEIFWTYCGRPCVSHLDVLGPKGVFVTELKVSQTSNPRKFRWQALRMLYHAQLAFYGQASQSIHGKPPRAYFIVAVSATAPYVVTVYRLTPKAIQLGQKCCRSWMEQLLQCEQANFWPGYSQSIVDLDGPDDEWMESEGVPF